MSTESLHLDLGCGTKPRAGHIGVDRKLGSEVYPLNYADESVDSITASHVLEHFSHGLTLHVLKEWVRVLKPNGTIRIAVPDFDKIVSAYQSPSGWPVESYLMGSHTDANDAHGAIFNEQKLRDLMTVVGLRSLKPWVSEQKDCAALPVSLNLMGTKRGKADLAGVQAILSAPRLCFTDQATCMVEAMSKLKIPTRIRQGVFWGQTLTKALEAAIADGAKTILTLDYDSLFKPEEVDELLWTLSQNPQADAICAMQMGRDRSTLLMSGVDDERRKGAYVEGEVFEADLVKVATGHFGLTAIRVSSLLKLEKPWLIHRPDQYGSWNEGSIDEDIHFWQAWGKAGNTLYQANRVVVGHMQLVATWPDRNLRPIHQLMTDYRQEGKPQGAWK
jgi:predicted SAM-dependent methyltransferase